ncbi:putative spermidine/putrescine transport system permease protein/spermidine/putrescine transport system permease protein [Aminobacter aminovorans]|uniref:Putrescine transport system permease protein PotH n=1 Tax=Aminobacter aminovorans TaxID=83263 RepID=A0A381INJ2_AMIAI|nr:ABC transporter permease [Aminobacter aminovorans]TCS24665.1 putative spermidine/putrescine transport system permease protein/spermidine/putrescine transport system permease protein [Aminobacter aminovorans]SUY29260.1 Putrescine transport system permease protein PotH [Aminobacter aminovorans]
MKSPGPLLALPTALIVLLLGFVPLIVILVWSFWTWDPATYWIRPEFSLAGYAAILEAGRWSVIVGSLGKAFLTAAISVVIGYPAAMAVHFLASRRTALLLMALFTIPFFTSYMIRAFSWRLVLGRNGLINGWLMDLGIVDQPLDWLLFSNFAVNVGLVASYLPFVIFPLILSMQRVEPSLLAASQDLGAGFWRTFRSVLLPLTQAGIFAGFLFVFVMAAGSVTEVQMLGGAAASMISVMINDVMRVVNFPLAFAISTLVLIILFGLIFIGNRLFKLTSLFEGFTW